MKVKLFRSDNGRNNTIEKELNDWLEANKNIHIDHVTQSFNQSTHYFYVLVFYSTIECQESINS